MWPNPQQTADLVTFTEEILNGKLYILCTVTTTKIELLCFFRSSHRRFSVRKGILRNFTKFTGKHLCQSLLFNTVADLRPEFCKVFKNTFFYRTLPNDCFCFVKFHMHFLLFLRLHNYFEHNLPNRDLAEIEARLLRCLFRTL